MPRILDRHLEQLAETDGLPKRHAVPTGEVRSGAVVMADASGFTKLTERLALEVALTLSKILILLLLPPSLSLSLELSLA